ncbi:sulfur stress regulator [Micractinium conductrix]|uniref:Sulfur stress regulator n=1 Tax=Micractinium conductrix TaxID=554055 RepID=A0A2P6VNW6_9CHLO|nr:sulfur stress regulator [Micractinium conductrix]|eukprot:PSC75745.1 sulfur stress regulator [Micractinium conductrix]
MRPLAIALLLGVALLASPAAAQLPASCLAAGFYTQNALLTALLPAYTLCPQSEAQALALTTCPAGCIDALKKPRLVTAAEGPVASSTAPSSSDNTTDSSTAPVPATEMAPEVALPPTAEDTATPLSTSAASVSNKPYMLYVGREILHQASLHHPFIVHVYEVFLTPQHLAIAMEFGDAGSLLTYLQRQPGRRLAGQNARWLFQQLVIGLSYTHHRGVANRDLKLENLLLCSNDADALRPLLKIGDFGYSSRGRADRRVELQHLRGTGGPARGRVASRAARRPLPARVRLTLAAHAAPPPDPPPARPQKADVWSIGVILYTMLVGGFPWTPGDRDCVLNITQAKYTIPQSITISQPCLELLSRILDPDPDLRAPHVPPPRRAIRIMEHPWFQADLPQGATSMNDFYFRNAPTVDHAAPQIAKILEHAAKTGSPDIAEVIERKENGQRRPTALVGNQRRRGTRAGRRGPVRAVAEPVEPKERLSKKVLNSFVVDKDIQGNNILLRAVKRRGEATYGRVVMPIERLASIIAMHHSDSLGYRGEKKLWNFLTLMAPTELQPAADGTERFAQGLAGFERTAIKIHLGTCPVRADQAPRKPDEKPAIKVITVDGPLSRINIDLVDMGADRDPAQRYVLAAWDFYTRFCLGLFALPTKHALLVGCHLYDLFTMFPRPAAVQCDDGSEFRAAVTSLCELLGIRVINSSPGNPQTNGVVERGNFTLRDMLYRIKDQINQKPCEVYGNQMSRYEALFGVPPLRTVHPPPEMLANLLQMSSWGIAAGLDEGGPGGSSPQAPATVLPHSAAAPPSSGAAGRGKKRSAAEAEVESEHPAKQMTTSAAAVAAYESSWGYAEESGPAGAARHAAAAAAAPPPGLSDFSEQLAELVAAQRAVAAAAAAVRSYSEAMGYADAGCVQRTAGAVPAEGLPELADLSDRLAELTQSFCVAPAVPSQWQYAQPGAARCGACADVLPSLADMSERLLELARKAERRGAAAAVPSWAAYATAGAARCGPCADAHLATADFAERLAELTAVPLPDWCQYCKPAATGRARFGACADSALDLYYMSQCLSELTKCGAAAGAADSSSLPPWAAYAWAKKGRARFGACADAPEQLCDMSERLAELAGC